MTGGYGSATTEPATACLLASSTGTKLATSPIPTQTEKAGSILLTGSVGSSEISVAPTTTGVYS